MKEHNEMKLFYCLNVSGNAFFGKRKLIRQCIPYSRLTNSSFSVLLYDETDSTLLSYVNVQKLK